MKIAWRGSLKLASLPRQYSSTPASFKVESEVDLNELILSEMGELVDAHSIGFTVLGIVGIDLGHVVQENTFPVGILKFRWESDFFTSLRPGISGVFSS